MQSLIGWSNLPEEFGLTVLLLSLVLFISPYFAGSDFGFLKVPAFKPAVRQRLYFLGPLLLAVSIGAHIPLPQSLFPTWETKTTQGGMEEGPEPETGNSLPTNPENEGQISNGTEVANPDPGERPPRRTRATRSEIQDIQRFLKRASLYNGPIDGVWGFGSESGLIGAQQRLGLPPTGDPEDALDIFDDLRTLDPPIECYVRFYPFDGILVKEPKLPSLKTGDVPQRRFRVLYQTEAFNSFWFQINIGDRVGWVKDFGHMTVTGRDCRRGT